MAISKLTKTSLRKTYDLGEGCINVTFPAFISQLKAVSDELEEFDVKQLIAKLQGMCIAEGVRPTWKKWDQEDHTRRIRETRQMEREARLKQKQESLEESRASVAMSFPDRVKATRKIRGDT